MGLIKKITIGLLFCVAITFVITSAVFAVNEAGVTGSGGESAYNHCLFLLTFRDGSCDGGAEWRYYKLSDPAPSHSTHTSNGVSVDGYKDYTFASSQSLDNCREEGGYWRHALVATQPAHNYQKGDQVGVLAIGGSGGYRSAKFSGGEVTERDGDAWNSAEAAYKSYVKAEEEEGIPYSQRKYKMGWDGDSSLGIFCSAPGGVETRTLTGFSIDKDGRDMGLEKVTDTKRKGRKATITRRDATGYTYLGWKENKGDENISVKNDKYTVEELNDNKTVYAVYEKNLFSGRATASQGEGDNKRESSTGWVESDKTADTLYIDCPAPSNFCPAKITFDIKRTKGTGETKYTIYGNNGNPVSGYNGAWTSDGKLNKTFDVNLKVGETVCYSMKARASEADNKWFIVKACVAAPYNFNNSTEVTIAKDEIIFAGEQKEITYNVTKGKRNNATIGKEYSTISPETAHGLQVSYDGGNIWEPGYEHPKETFSEENNGRSGTITFRDVDAGASVCIRSYVMPANSGSDTNLDITKFNGTAYSPDKAKCFFVAKRPNMQVLGGSYYSGKKTETSTAIKHMDDGTIKVFGSWGEQSVIGVGMINGLASGSANSLTLGSNTGFCQYRTLLTFNNIPCNGNSTEKGIGVATANDNRDALVDYWVADSIKGTDNGVVYVNDDRNIVQTIAGKNVQYTNTQDEIRVNGGTLTKGTTRIIKTSRNATIVGNIVYEDGYGGVADIPKMIISADTITISCNVDRIDAILIAKNSINTCNDHISYGDKETGPANAAEQNRQLLVRGMVIANKLIPSRTHGAGTKEKSGEPAETINYDSSTMLWAQYMAGNDDSGALTVTYQRELAPRY